MKIKHLAISIAIPLAVGLVSGFLTRNGMQIFAMVNKPPLSPPAWLFPVVWTILYVLMGVASYLVANEGRDREDVQKALDTYAVQLFFNFAWSIIFFNFGWYLFAFTWLMAMWALIIRMFLQYKKINKTAAYLTIPYLAWVTFAAYLNLGIYLLN